MENGFFDRALTSTSGFQHDTVRMSMPPYVPQKQGVVECVDPERKSWGRA